MLLALSARQENILAISQWVEDQKTWLLETVGIRTRSGLRKLPSQASLYRFLWCLEQDILKLEACLTRWVQEILTLKNPDGALICVNVDGKHLLDTSRFRAGQSALVLVGAFLNDFGLTLTQTLVTSTKRTRLKA